MAGEKRQVPRGAMVSPVARRPAGLLGKIKLLQQMFLRHVNTPQTGVAYLASKKLYFQLSCLVSTLILCRQMRQGYTITLVEEVSEWLRLSATTL